MVCKWYSCCPIKRHVEEGLIDPYWTNHYCLKDGGFKECVRYEKEERGEFHPDNMLPDGSVVNLKRSI